MTNPPLCPAPIDHPTNETELGDEAHCIVFLWYSTFYFLHHPSLLIHKPRDFNGKCCAKRRSDVFICSIWNEDRSFFNQLKTDNEKKPAPKIEVNLLTFRYFLESPKTEETYFPECLATISFNLKFFISYKQSVARKRENTAMMQEEQGF